MNYLSSRLMDADEGGRECYEVAGGGLTSRKEFGKH